MIHTVQINDETPIGKRILNDLRKHQNEVVFNNKAEINLPPEGYMTGDEFFSGIKKELMKRCQENGLLQ